MPDQYGNFRFEIYLQGLGGVIPELPMTFAELEAQAQQAMSPSRGRTSTAAAETRAHRWRTSTHSGTGVDAPDAGGCPERDLSIELFGRRWATPIFHNRSVSPGSTQDRHGDLAVARAAARTKVPMCISTLTMDPMEDIAAEFGDTQDFSSSIRRDRELAESFVHRAEAARLCGDCGHPRHLGSRLASPRPDNGQFPAAARQLPVQPHQRPGLQIQSNGRHQRRSEGCGSRNGPRPSGTR